MAEPIALSLNLELIQSIRLVHAIAACGVPVRVDPPDVGRFSVLREQFPFEIDSSVGPARTLTEVVIDHSTPATSIGRISRPLIFPHSLPRWCRQEWQPEDRRDITVSFCGLLTEARVQILKGWLTLLHQDTAKVDALVDRPLVRWFKGHFMRRFQRRDMTRREQSFDLSIGRVVLWSSRRSRVPGQRLRRGILPNPVAVEVRPLSER